MSRIWRAWLVLLEGKDPEAHDSLQAACDAYDSLFEHHRQQEQRMRDLERTLATIRAAVEKAP